MIEQLRQNSGLDVRQDVSLKDYTTFKIGGPAKFFVEVKNKNDLRQALQLALDFKLKYFILGAGSNVLISDDGFDGLIIHPVDTGLEIKGNLVQAFCGVSWPRLVADCLKQSLGSLEFSANIPGSVGGCVRGNAGAYGQAVGDFVKEVEVLIVDKKEVGLKIITKQECEFDYRESIFKKNQNWIISEVVFELKKVDDQKQALSQIKKEALKRRAKQPLQYPSAGCSFKNIEYTDGLKQYESWQSHGKIPAARLIDEAGLKGKQIGGAKISDKHANFIVNTGNATANDIVQLISLIKTKVRDEFGVQLEEEVQYVGF